jgi:enoyl-CoA hydratase/carnithine racemase
MKQRTDGHPASPTDEVVVERRGAIQWIVLNRPQVRNAMSVRMYQRLFSVCADVERDLSIRAIVVTGAGNAFSAGGDISSFRALRTEQDAIDYDAVGNAAFTAIESVRVPVVAALAGPCTGGGALIAASCDVRIASPSARFGVPIARTLGNCLSTRDLSRLVRFVGAPRARDLLISARLLSAQEMLAAGLVSEVTLDEDSLLSRAQDLAEQIAGYAPLTLRATKESFLRLRANGPDAANEDLMATCYLSSDFRNAVEAFLAGRSPEWKGE